MIRLSALYPTEDGKNFNLDYYSNKHVPMVRKLLGNACKMATIEQGLSGLAPASKPAYAVMGHLYFDSIDDLQQSFGVHAETIVADIPNFTDIAPVVQIGEVIQ
jgi:uncharacterized protein (TIGR02118 family)